MCVAQTDREPWVGVGGWESGILPKESYHIKGVSVREPQQRKLWKPPKVSDRESDSGKHLPGIYMVPHHLERGPVKWVSYVSSISASLPQPLVPHKLRLVIWRKRKGQERVNFQSSWIHIRTAYSSFWEEIVATGNQRICGYMRRTRSVKKPLQVSNQEQGKATTCPRRFKGRIDCLL